LLNRSLCFCFQCLHNLECLHNRLFSSKSKFHCGNRERTRNLSDKDLQFRLILLWSTRPCGLTRSHSIVTSESDICERSSVRLHVADKKRVHKTDTFCRAEVAVPFDGIAALGIPAFSPVFSHRGLYHPFQFAILKSLE
jgi:hypothetical protein